MGDASGRVCPTVAEEGHMRAMKRSRVAIWLVLAGVACGGSGGSLDELTPRSEPVLTLHVKNQNFYDAAVYALAPAVPEKRIGTVPGNSVRALTFRWTWTEVQIQVRLVGAASFVTETMPVMPGDELAGLHRGRGAAILIPRAPLAQLAEQLTLNQ